MRRRRTTASAGNAPAWLPSFERLENRCVLSAATPFTIGVVELPTDPTVQVSGVISQAGGRELYQVTIDTQGLLVATVNSSGINTLLSLQDSQGNVLIQSEASSATDPVDRIAQHLPAGTYDLAVSDTVGVGSFSLSTSFTQASAPGVAISEGAGAYEVTTAEVNGDGKPDVIVPDYYDNQILINLGIGDGTFQPPTAIPVGSGPVDVLTADLSGDGQLDLVVVDQLSDDLMILKGDGHGNFQVSQVLTTRPGPMVVVAGDFSGDGRMDLAVADTGANGVEIFHNLGNGTFVESAFIGSISNPTSLVVADPNGNGKPGLAVTSSSSGSLFLLDGEGNDQFVPLPYQLPVGAGASDVIAANLSGGRLPDLVAVSPDTGMISIFHYDGFSYRLQGTLQGGSSPEAVDAADFNGDGRLDLAAVNYVSNDVSVFLGNGDGTFGAATSYPTGSGPMDLATADFSGSGRADLVTTNFIELSLSVLINNGDATFTGPPVNPPSAGPEDVVVADLTGNGISDLIVADTGLNEVSIFLGRGDGTFRNPIQIPAGSEPEDVTVGDYTGDGIPDLAVADFGTNTVMILQGNGDGSFQPIGTLPTGDGPAFIEAADLNGNGHLDLVVADYIGNDIDVFYGRGDGTFATAVSYLVGLAPSGIAISDLNGDGRLDIAVSDSASDDVDVLLATGLGTFASPISYPAGAQPWKVTAGDFNGDGHPDLIVADGLSSPASVSLLMGVGNGTFLPSVSFGVGEDPFPIAVGDFTGDGDLDVFTGNEGVDSLSLLLGNGKGTFATQTDLPGGTDPYGLAVGDFNGDGHLDLVAVNYSSSDLTVYMGRGNGTFESAETIPILSPELPTITADLEGNGVPQVIEANPEAGTISVFNSQGDGTLQLISTIDVGGTPSGLAVGDFNRDGRPDLAVTDSSSGKVLILLGLGNGTFQSPIRYSVGKSPQSPVLGDFSNNGILDIAVADTDSNEVSVLYGRGDGTFAPARNFPVGLEPISLLVGNGDTTGYLDLATVNRSSDDLTELVGIPGGKFFTATLSLAGITPTALVSGDFNSDGQPDFIVMDDLKGIADVALDYATNPNASLIPIEVGVGTYLVASADLYNNGESDLILANTDSGLVTILSGWANNTFQTRSTFHVDVEIAGLSIADLNEDGLLDILITQAGTGVIETYLSGGNGVFSVAESVVPLPHPAPLVFPLAPGLSDIYNIDNNGQALLRLGIPGEVAEFSASINETSGTSIAIRDFAYVLTGGIPDVASLDTKLPVIFVENATATGPDAITVLELPDEGNYTRLISGDLFGTGRDDLVVINRTLDEIIIEQQVSSGVFRQYGEPIPAGFGPTDVTLANLTPGGLPDLVVADGSSGAVTLINRTAQGGFVVGATLPAGIATAGTVLLSDGLNRSSPDEPVGVTSGIFGPSGLADVAVIDYGTDRISILQGLPDGGLSAPTLALTYSTGLDPIQVLAAPLTRNGLLDLIVLNEGSDDISIFLNNGHGGFIALPRVDAGDNPTSLAVSDLTNDGVPELVVSNANGDVLILNGNGDGTFQPYQRADGTVSLAVGDLTGNGESDFVLTSTSKDWLSVQTASSSTGFVQGRSNGLLAPGPVLIADMTGDGINDLIVANTGGNDVLVYLGLGNGRFAPPQEFFTGTSPIGLTAVDLADSGDGLLDLVVANSGSNDVTILLGKLNPDGSWTMVPGPRLNAGQNPVSTTVADLYDNGEQDILVVNQDSNTVTVLRGLGGGFFDDTDPLTLPTGQSPVQAFVGHFSSSTDPGIVVLNSLSNNMTFYADINARSTTISSGGIDPISGVMGDFNHDGYSDLAVANSGNSNVTLFDGGAAGLTLDQTIMLGVSTHPTDLVVSTTPGGGVQFYVGAQGDDHAIPVTFAATATIEVIGTAPTQGDLAGSISQVRLSSGSSSSASEFNSTVFQQSVDVAGGQSQESASTGATSGGAASGVGLASAMVTTLTQAIQPLFSPSSRSLGWLLDNLVQLAQGQTAEILPIGKNEMAAVAVLLSTSSIARPEEETGLPPSPVPTEDNTPIAVFIPGEAATPLPSRLDRFVANLGVSTVDYSREVIAGPGRSAEFGPDWVWHRRTNDATAITASFEKEQESRSASKVADETVEVALETDLEIGNAEEGPEEDLRSGTEASFLSNFAITVASVATLGIAFIAAKRFDRNTFVSLFRKRSCPTQLDPISGPIKERSRLGSSWSSAKSRNTQDLPPWLQGLKSTKTRRSLADRTYAASFFRNRTKSE